MPSLRGIPPVHSPIRPIATATALARPDTDALPRLEATLADLYDADAVVLTGSGTQALQLALALARRRTGRDAAALPAFTCYDLVTAAVGAGVRPAFYDIDPDRLDPEPESLGRALDRELAAVVVVHHFGYPAPLPEIADALPPGAWLIEDAAQAHGGTLEGRRLGSLAPLSVLSFGRGKGWTGGGGGALLLRGEAADVAEEARGRLAPAAAVVGSAVKLAAQWLLARPSLYGVPSSLPWLGLGETRYREPEPPAAMAAGTAAVVLANGPAAEAEIAVRRRNAAALHRALQQIAAVRVPGARGEPGYLRLPVRAPGRLVRRSLTRGTAKLGLAASYPLPLPALQPVVQARIDTGAVPGAELLSRELFTIPTHSWTGSRDPNRIGSALGRAFS